MGLSLLTEKRREFMSVSDILQLASGIANHQPTKFPAMKFSDWDLLIRCIREQTAKTE